MIHSQAPAVHLTIGLGPVAMVPATIAPVTVTPAALVSRAPPPLWVFDGIGRLVRRGALVVLLIPIMLPLAVVALLVPWCLRVPVCGPRLPRHR